MRILSVCGSLRAGSHNRRLLQAAERVVPAGVEVEYLDVVGSLPLFDEDLEPDVPATVVRLRERFAAADALLIASPEYNGSFTGVLKNLLDWASRPGGDSILAGLPTAVIGGSSGQFGAAWSLQDTRRTADRIGARVLPLEVAVPRIDEAFDDDGRLRDPGLDAALQRLVDALVDVAAGRTSLDELAERDDAVSVTARG